MCKYAINAVLLLLSGIASPLVFSQSGPTQNEIASFGELHKAAHSGDTEQILALVKAGAELEIRDGAGRTPLIVAAFASQEASVEALASIGADLDALEFQDYDIVTIAAVANDIEMLDLALSLGASAGNITSPYEGTALIAAAHLGHVEVVDKLIQYEAPLDHINNLNWTALMESVVLGDGGADHVATAKLLLDAGADPKITDSQGITPAEHAKSRGYKEMLKLFDSES